MSSFYKKVEKWEQNNKNNVEHFKKSTILTPYFQKYEIRNISNNYQKYFGDFCFLFEIKDFNIFTQEIIKIYDLCKGFCRKLTCDPICIKWVKNSLLEKKEYKYDEIKKYLYNYYNIHAHTMALFSLSILLFRITLHHMFCNNIITFKECYINEYFSFNKKYFECNGCKRICDRLYENSLCQYCFYDN